MRRINVFSTLLLVSTLGCETTPPTDDAPASAQAMGAEAVGVGAVDGSGTAAPLESADDDVPGSAAAELSPSAAPPLALAGTTWVREGADGATDTLLFMDRLVSWSTGTDAYATYPYDASGLHPACLGVPGCIAVVRSAADLVFYFAYLEADQLWFARCTDWGETPMPDDASTREQGFVPTYREGTVLCTVGVDEAGYRLSDPATR